MFLIVTNQAGQEKQKSGFWISHPQCDIIWVLYFKFMQKTKVHVECMSLTLLCTVKKIYLT